MAVREPDQLECLLGKTSHRHDIWLWLFLKQYGKADFELSTCNGRTMRDTLANFLETEKAPSLQVIFEATDRFLVEDESVGWIADDERQTRWLAPKIKEMTQLGEIWDVPRLKGKDLLLGAIDLWEVSISVKNTALRNLSNDWGRHIRKDAHLKWFEDTKEGADRRKFAWEWIQKDKQLTWFRTPCFSSHTDLLIFFDSADLREREIKEISQSVRRSWNRQRYLEKLEGKKKQYNFILSMETIELLDELAKTNGLKRPQILERLIIAEAEQGTYLPQKVSSTGRT
ncbi:hypothetical protein [Stutzerimonas balearica]|jgi:hypothetical protein|uniref:hypothetical protein n=1 Tax=Stutzerimonas balearica TaxID=74829 RepID=UPI001BC8DB21|nr:hypothetical protein [Stutzerimonas balearica]MBS4152167.1 hypothetical protein [Stutzerimonas balearica]